MPAVTGVTNNGVILRGLSTLPSATEMLTVDPTGLMGRQSIPVGSFGSLTGSPSDNAALAAALAGKVSLSGDTMTGPLNGTSAAFNATVAANMFDVPQNGSNQSLYRFSSGGVGRGALVFNPSRLEVGLRNDNYSSSGEYSAYVDGSGNFRLRNANIYNSSPVFTVSPSGATTQSNSLTLSYNSVTTSLANGAYANSGALVMGGSRPFIKGNLTLCKDDGTGIKIYDGRLEPAMSEGLNANDNAWDIGQIGYNRFRHLYMSGNVVAGSSSAFEHYQRTRILSPSDGKLQITNNGGTSGVQLDFATNGVMSLRDRTDSGAGSFNAGAITATGEIRGAGRITSGVAPNLGSGFYITSNGIDVGSIFAGDGAMNFRGLEGNGNRYRADSHTFQNRDGTAYQGITALNGAFTGTITASGTATVSRLVTSSFGTLANPAIYLGVASHGIFADGGVTQFTANSGSPQFGVRNGAGVYGAILANNSSLSWASLGSDLTGGTEIQQVRSATGQLDIRADSGLRLRNLANSGWSAIQVGAITANGRFTSTSDFDVVVPSSPSTRETIFKARVSDAGNDAFHIYNATINDGGFAPGFSGSRFTSNSFALAFIAQTDSVNDTGTTPMMLFETRRTSSQADPNNGTLSGITTRPAFAWQTFGTEFMRMSAAGNLGIGSTNPNVALVIRRSGTDLPSLRLEDGDITVPFTGVGINPTLQANTVGVWSAMASASGGCGFSGFTNNSATAYPLAFVGYHGSTSPTKPAINFSAFKSDGGSNSANLASNELIAGFFNGTVAGSPVATIAADGTIAASSLSLTGTLTHGFQPLVADPSTVDITNGLIRAVKNTTTGELRIWANDSNVMKSILFS